MRFVLNEEDLYHLRREAILWYRDETQAIPIDPSTYNEVRSRVPYVVFAQGVLERCGEARRQNLNFGPPQDDTVFSLPLNEILTLVRLLKAVGIVG